MLTNDGYPPIGLSRRSFLGTAAAVATGAASPAMAAPRRGGTLRFGTRVDGDGLDGLTVRGDEDVDRRCPGLGQELPTRILDHPSILARVSTPVPGQDRQNHHHLVAKQNDFGQDKGSLGRC